MSMSHRANKRFGQHFLVNPSIARKIAEASALTPADRVLEIGPGLGILTGELLIRAEQVTAVEIDRTLIPELTAKFSSNPRFRLIEGDILAVDIGALFKDTGKRITVAANIPYNITTPIIALLCANRSLIDRAVLMVQREVADRLLAQPGTKTFGLTTLNLSLSAECRRVMNVSPGSFRPPPEVMSTVVALTFSPEPRFPLADETLFRRLTGAAFRQRRKMLKNSLIPFLASLGVHTEDAHRILQSAGIAPDTRPETVDTGRFVALTNAVSTILTGT
ncbi:16S rRNA (adenine(1518)-N(6)/adenine(1519)-N(6))-dimethyltransferase RsmA [Candidatus Latescibacterota bacterium]